MTAATVDLVAIGWTDDLQRHLEALEGELEPARVAIEHKGSFLLFTNSGELTAEISGRVSYSAISRSDLPAVGDWVAIARSDDLATIQAVLPRRGTFTRKVAGAETQEQIVAANVDIVLVCSALGEELNVRRIERYLTAAWQSGAVPCVVLTKADECPDIVGQLEAVRRVALDVEVLATSAVTGFGMDELTRLIGQGRTVALLGSSGVGKSTLVNRLVGEELMTTRQIRSDGKGRHATNYRRLIPLPGGGALIDTPGMRELQLWGAEEGMDETFAEIFQHARNCRFRDCSHGHEPGCAVKEALVAGELDASRFANYQKQRRELAALARRTDKRLAAEESKRWRKINRDARARSRRR